MLDKLFRDCEKCGGRGQWVPPIEFHGNSQVLHGPRTCPECNGVGVIPSADGELIIDLIERFRRAGRLR
jgi:DnaJ-class molecular chaperone